MNRHVALHALALLPFLLAASQAEAQWPQFRGPNGSGVATDRGYPVEFSPSKNVIWKAAVPFGQSSPVLAGDRLFVTASQGEQLVTICLDAGTGRELWRREIARERTHAIYRSNDPASPTPAADADGVIVFFPDVGLVAYSSEGQERWRHPMGPFRNFYGMAASPILADGLVILVCDQQAGSFVVALDRASGRVRWTTERRGRTVGWATPMVFRPAGGTPQLIVLGSTWLDAYDLPGGEPRWWMPVASMGALGTPVATDDTVMVSTLATAEPWMPEFRSQLEKHDGNKDGRLSAQEFAADQGWAEHFGWIDDNGDGTLEAAEWNAAREMGMGEFGAVAVRPGAARGRLGAEAVRWRFQKNLPFVPAPLVYEGVFYLVRDGGIITSLDAATGALRKEGRTREAMGEYFASPIAADGKIFLANGDGKVTVLGAGAQWEVLRVNDLGEEIRATPALGRGRLYIRTREGLYCFGTTGA